MKIQFRIRNDDLFSVNQIKRREGHALRLFEGLENSVSGELFA